MEDEIGEELSAQTSLLGVRERRPRQPDLANSEDDIGPASKIHSAGVLAIDITAYFTDATSRLDVGQLIKDDFFTLFESVGAIEIMDPKMDTGFLAAGESMEDDYDVMRHLLPEELLGIIDQLLCVEMAWHMGHPLSQTIFTSLYIDDLLSSKIDQLENISFGKRSFRDKDLPLTLRILRAYCLGLLKTCWFVNNRVKSEHFYEEEDFVTHTYNQSLLDNIPEQQILSYLKELTEDLQSSKEVVSQDLIDALGGRLKFRYVFMKAVSVAEHREISDINEGWSDVLKALPGVEWARRLGKSCPDSFSAKVQRKLASSVPPRPLVNIAFETAFEFLTQMCHDGQSLTEVLHYHDSQSLMTFVVLYQSRKLQASVYIRSLLQYYISGDMVILGSLSIRELMDDDLANLVLPQDYLLDSANDEVEHPLDPRFVVAKRMEAFRSKAAQTYLDTFRTYCQNRCRIRRNLKHTIVDWDNLQMDAEELDQELRQYTGESPIVVAAVSSDPIYSFPLSSWAYFYKIRQMEMTVQMGFELEVYQDDELPSMYWYLQHLNRTRISHLERIREFVLRNLSKHPNDTNKDQAKRREAFSQAVSFLNCSMLEATATRGFADALSCFYVVLRRSSLLNSPSRPFSNDAMRYEIRMKPFLQVGLPEPLPYAVFNEAVLQPEESTEDLMKFAAVSVAKARKDFELLSKLDGKTARYIGSEERWKLNVRNCIKSCISANISISMVQKAMDTAVNRKLEVKVEIPAVEKGYHDWWIVPKILRE